MVLGFEKVELVKDTWGEWTLLSKDLWVSEDSAGVKCISNSCWGSSDKYRGLVDILTDMNWTEVVIWLLALILRTAQSLAT